MTLQERIAAARATAPDKAPESQPPANAYKLSGLFIKGDKNNSSWVATVVGLQENGSLALEFSDFFNEIDWKNKKGDVPRGIKTWHLPEGIYKAKIVEKRDEEPHWLIFAVVDGQRDDLTEAVVATLLTESGTPAPPEEQIP